MDTPFVETLLIDQASFSAYLLGKLLLEIGGNGIFLTNKARSILVVLFPSFFPWFFCFCSLSLSLFLSFSLSLSFAVFL